MAKNTQPTPKHTPEVEKVAKQIIIYGIVFAAICTIIVMVIP